LRPDLPSTSSKSTPASNRGIDQIRELREMVRYAPAASRSKVVILDEAHMLTSEASNALLKTLEEPPDRVIFVMATTEPENLEDTIRSRSQHFHFRVLTFNEIADRIKYIAKEEGLTIADGAVAVIARMAEGSMRDALSLLEQARAYCGDKIPDKEVRELLGVVPRRHAQRTGRSHRRRFRRPRARPGPHLPERGPQPPAFLPRSHSPHAQSADRARLAEPIPISSPPTQDQRPASPKPPRNSAKKISPASSTSSCKPTTTSAANPILASISKWACSASSMPAASLLSKNCSPNSAAKINSLRKRRSRASAQRLPWSPKRNATHRRCSAFVCIQTSSRQLNSHPPAFSTPAWRTNAPPKTSPQQLQLLLQRQLPQSPRPSLRPQKL
jgi:hypothetical protein